MVNRVMTVSERRYLKKNSTVFCSGQIFGVCSTKPLESAYALLKPKYLTTFIWAL